MEPIYDIVIFYTPAGAGHSKFQLIQSALDQLIINLYDPETLILRIDLGRTSPTVKNHTVHLRKEAISHIEVMEPSEIHVSPVLQIPQRKHEH